MAIKNGKIVEGTLEEELQHLSDKQLCKECDRFQEALNRARECGDEAAEYQHGVFLHAHEWELKRRLPGFWNSTFGMTWERVVDEIPGIND